MISGVNRFPPLGSMLFVVGSTLGCGPAGDVEVDVEVGASGLSFEPQAETNATTVSSTAVQPATTRDRRVRFVCSHFRLL